MFASRESIYKVLKANNYPNAHSVSNLLSSLDIDHEMVINKILKGEPLDYVLGSVEFYDAKIAVNSSVLIPRPETELLVDLVSNEIKKDQSANLAILDLCTGSGCIAISLKKKFPSLKVSAVDKSQEALDCAKKNAKLNQVEIEFILSDLLESMPKSKFDIVICNPPYISLQEYETLDPSVRLHEPMMALTDFGDGLEIYKRLGKDLMPFLNPYAKVFFEIGYNQAEAVTKIFSTPFWTKLSCKNDYAGHGRFFSLESAC